MKYLILFLIVGACVFSVKAQERITVEMCQQWARTNYPLVQQFDLIRLSEEYNLSNAGKGNLPQFSVSAKATLQTEVTRLPVQLPGIDIKELSKDQYQAVAELNQVIWNGGRTRAQKESIRKNTEVEKLQVEVQLYTLNEQVNQLFFGVLLLSEQLEQNRLYQEELQVNYEKIASYIRNGVANQADLDVIRVEQVNAGQKETELTVMRKAYKEMLALLTGKNIVADQIMYVKPVLDSVNVKQVNRPELQLLDVQDKYYTQKRDLVNAGVRPGISLFVQGGYGRPGLNMLNDKFSLFSIGGVRLSWNIGGFYTRKNDFRLIDNSQQSLAVQRSVFLFNTDLQVTRQSREIDKIRRLLSSDGEIVRLRNNIRVAAEAKVAHGIYTTTDLVREINAEEQAKQTQLLHRIQLMKAVYDLKYTVNN